MSLRTKLFLISFLVFIVSVFLTAMLVETIVRPSFHTLEEMEAQRHLRRCRRVLAQEITHLDTLVKDWSAWDDTYEFVQDANEEYIASNLTDTTFTDLDIQLLLILNPQGDMVWGRALRHDRPQTAPLDDMFSLPFAPDFPLLQHQSPANSLSGLYMSHAGPLIISARPILTSQDTGPCRGTLIMGRFLKGEMVLHLSQQTESMVYLWTMSGESVTSNQSITPPAFDPDSRQAFVELNDSVLMAATVIPDVFAHPSLILEMRLDRPIILVGKASIAIFYAAFLFGGLLIVVGLFLFLKSTVTSPILWLSRHATAVGDNTRARPTGLASRNDEIGVLARAFETMLGRLAEARKSLMERSYQSGQSATAAGLLHNVRNTLTPISTELESLSSHIGSLVPDAFERAVTELVDPETPGERRTELVRYLTLSLERIRGRAADDHRTVCSLMERLGRVEEILHSYSHLARSEPVLEILVMSELLQDAKGFLPTAIRRRLNLLSDVQGVEVLAERITLLQVVDNILSNAVEAKQDAGGGMTTVRVSALPGDGADRVSIAFVDDGPGITPKVRDHVFERGYSTKKTQGHTGLGLHWCSTTLSALGGSIALGNTPEGTGATVIITLPLPGSVGQEADA